jgi:hypothetical protein
MRSLLPSTRSLAFAVSMAVSSFPMIACTATPADVESQSNEVRSVTTEEALADFDQLASSFRGLYGALERKEARYGFRFDALVREYRERVAQASKDSEFQGIFVEFLARFKDGHVSISTQFTGSGALISDDSHVFSLPVSAMPVENTFVIYDVVPGTSGQVHVGDELLGVDGVDAETLVQSFLKFASTANPLAARHFAARRLTNRAPFLSAGIQAGSTATLRLRGVDGAERTAVVPWREAPHAFPPVARAPVAGTSTRRTIQAHSSLAEEVTRAELAKSGAPVPFFMTPQVATALAFQAVVPSVQGLAKFKVTPEAAEMVAYFAGTYLVGGMRVLLLRIPHYHPVDQDAAAGWLRALIDEQQPNVDALVLDQTHNPGGDLFFANAVASILSPRPFNGFAQKCHADRMWLTTYAREVDQAQSPELAKLLLADARKIDDAYSAHQSHAPAFGPLGSPNVLTPDDVHWSKPSIMLIDELAGSCGDVVPALMRSSAIMPLFGQTTMGSAGNVEQVATLTNTRWTLNLPRGLGTVYDPTGAYPEAGFIDDNGVTPNVTYNHTLADYRAGYVGYVSAFNAELARQLAPTR